jgi:hypothetical protein
VWYWQYCGASHDLTRSDGVVFVNNTFNFATVVNLLYYRDTDEIGFQTLVLKKNFAPALQLSLVQGTISLELSETGLVEYT